MKRTTLRSSSGKKLYARRNAAGQFLDIQTFKRAHGADIKRTAKSEKRQRLINYITAFAVEMGAPRQEARAYNTAWERMIKKIDKLELW